MSKHRAQLHRYFLDVTRELAERGVIRRARGESLIELIKNEFPVVLAEVREDFVAEATDLGIGIVAGGIRALEVQGQKAMQFGAQMVGSFLADLFTGKK